MIGSYTKIIASILMLRQISLLFYGWNFKFTLLELDKKKMNNFNQ